MDELLFKKRVAQKIAYYRKKQNLTQGDLAERLNYSDKSVSKWERGEGLPDAYVLYEMTKIFGITLNDFVSENDPAKTDISKERKKYISILSVGLVWLVASVAFFAVKIFFPTLPHTWLSFIYAIPVSFIVGTVFCCLWYGMVARAVSVSGIVWGVFVSLLLTFGASRILYFVIACAVFQMIIILWFVMRHRTKKKQ